MSSEGRNDGPSEKEYQHKTKLIQFLGRTTPIILQNDNGPCPLLAICNVLSLKNNLNLSADTDEVSQEKLLSLVADRLIESNSNVNDKDPEYAENQQQNISDAIDLLPRLATGIDVNIKFRRVDDFEFTRECAIFDLLDIPLYHGWIVDPQDYDTASAIGDKSYNTIMGDLVALETRNMEGELNNILEESPVDFVAATTAALGVPSPSLSRNISFNDSPRSLVFEHQKFGKGDMEEEAEMITALKLSEIEIPTSHNSSLITDVNGEKSSVASTGEGTIDEHCGGGNQNFHVPVPPESDYSTTSSIKDNSFSQTSQSEEVTLSSKIDEDLHIYQPSLVDSQVCSQSNVVDNPSSDVLANKNYKRCTPCNDVALKTNVDASICVSDPVFIVENLKISLEENELALDQSTSISNINEPRSNQDCVGHRTDLSSISPSIVDFDSSSSEPMYEGEECILDSGTIVYEENEPMYEGEVVLAEQADKGTLDSSNVSGFKDELTPYQGELIRNFLKSNASQLTINGLFCLQEGLKERELCVFFRNNHFSTMFKFEGELYFLATDQGYLNQPDLVWEKLNEVNGNTLFMTGNFKEFKLENRANDSWDEQNVMTSTVDYLANIDNSRDLDSGFSSDYQLAIALQKQEFEEQPNRQNFAEPSTGRSSRLVTGPQVSSARPIPVPPKQDAKSKEKCIIM